MSWQAGVAAGAVLMGTIIQSLIALNRPSYDPQGWQGTLFAILVSAIMFSINIWGAKALSSIQNFFFVLHVLSFIAVMIILWIMARTQSAEAVFTRFENFAGWNSMGLSLMVGQVNAAYLITCVSINLLGFWLARSNFIRFINFLHLFELTKGSQLPTPLLICLRKSTTPA